MSPTGRQRMFLGTFKTAAIAAVVLASCWGGYEIVRTWEENPAKIKAPVKSVPVRDVVFQGTDGVLDKAWVVRTLALPKGAGLMELDLYALREKLFVTGQVKSAILTRKFPDLLLVRIEERSPVARLRAEVKALDGPKDFLVARDGVVFEGENYDAPLLGTLPYLEGFTLKRSGQGFAPIGGMETVADLLTTAHTNISELYRGWTRVSLAKLATDGEIVVTSRDIPQIVFGTHEDFYKQVAKLDYIVDDAKAQPNRALLNTVNLAIGGEQVPVALQPLADTAAGAATEGATAKPSTYRLPADHALRAAPQRPTALSNSQHFLKRDF